MDEVRATSNDNEMDGTTENLDFFTPMLMSTIVTTAMILRELVYAEM